MAGGTFPRGFEQMLGRSRSVATTQLMRWTERNGGGAAQRRTPTSIRNGEGGTFYFDTEVSPDGFDQITGLVDVTIGGPARKAHLYVTLTGFEAPYDGDYPVVHMANTYLGVVPVREASVGATFSVLVGDYTAPTVFAVDTPNDEGTVNATLWVPEVG